ncbi:MAG: DUF885 domain-containing protein [Balneolaceae bacterium]
MPQPDTAFYLSSVTRFRSGLPAFTTATVLLLFFVLVSCTASSDADQLHALMDETDEFSIRENPFRADEEGETQHNDQLQSESVETLERHYQFWNEIENRLLESVNRENLEFRDKITYDSFRREVASEIKGFEFQEYLIPINHEGGFYNRMIGLENRVPLETVQDYEDYLTRLRAIPEYFNQHIDRMRTGMEIAYTLPRVIFVEEYDHYIETHIPDDPAESGFYEPFTEFPDSFSEEDRERLAEEGYEAVAGVVLPTYRAFVDFLHQEYIPEARETIGTTDLPDGEAYYNHLIEHHTTLPLSATEVHQIGLGEVERILEEMYEIIDEVGFEGTFAEFLEFLRTDSQFYVEEPVDLLKEASYLAKRMDGKLPDLFHLRNLPRRTYGVEPVPDHLAPRYTGGRYAGGGGPGAAYFWVNTYALESRPLYTLEALAYHEAVPGHHLQIALNREMEDLPRRSGGLTVFSEGWALYSERLGLDVGLYDNPYYNFGRLTYEMWRACRLVVDTGMHALGWSRQEAVDFLTDHTALSHHEIDTEINRYIAVPGQALAYKMGELKIRELRGIAEERLGENFDIRDFHEAVLQNGPVTLPVLEEQVTAYISEVSEQK